MSINHRPKEKQLDDELCFKKWYELGSLVKVQRYHENNGIINERTGKPFTAMAYWVAAMRWVLDHPDDAREYYKNLDGLDFDPGDDDEWWSYLVGYAVKDRRFFSRIRLAGWVKEHNLEKYLEEDLLETLSNFA